MVAVAIVVLLIERRDLPCRFKDGANATKYFNVDPVYLKHEHQAVAADYRVSFGIKFLLKDK